MHHEIGGREGEREKGRKREKERQTGRDREMSSIDTPEKGQRAGRVRMRRKEKREDIRR